MAGRRKQKEKTETLSGRLGRRLRRWFWRGLSIIFLLAVAAVLLFALVNPYRTPYMVSESWRLDGIRHEWVAMDRIAPVMARAAVAAEDANFCEHWGFDVRAIRLALEEGSNRGASTISQQVVKNVYLWQGRSWLRKAMEAGLTPLVEALWSKRRILEVYLNVAEFDEGVFGVGAAARHYFGVAAADLSDSQAARLAAILPSPKTRSAARPDDFTRGRAAAVRDGAATIGKDGRAACFQS
jgi:monofunctional biosynthetic peptidoglycan transglycosylase